MNPLWLQGPEVVCSCLCRYFRVALLPSSTDVSCLFRTKVHPATEPLLFSDMFRVAISQVALQQKTLRVDLCCAREHCAEECLVGGPGPAPGTLARTPPGFLVAVCRPDVTTHPPRASDTPSGCLSFHVKA